MSGAEKLMSEFSPFYMSPVEEKTPDQEVYFYGLRMFNENVGAVSPRYFA